MKKLHTILLIISLAVLSVLPIKAASEVSSTLQVIDDVASPEYAETYLDLYSAVVPLYIDRFEIISGADSPDSVANVVSGGFEGSSSLAVQPLSDSLSTLTFDMSQFALTGFQYIVFAVKCDTPEHMRLSATLDGYEFGGEESRVSATTELSETSGWQTVFFDISRFTASDNLDKLTITLERSSNAVMMNTWYIDALGVSGEKYAPRFVKYLAGEYSASGGRIHTDIDSIRLNVTGDAPYIESATVYDTSTVSADSLELSFEVKGDRANFPVGVRVYYADAASPVFDLSRSVYKELDSSFDGGICTMNFETGRFSRVRIAFEGMTSGTLYIRSIRATASGSYAPTRLGGHLSCEVGDARHFKLTGYLTPESSAQFRHLRVGLYELRSLSDYDLIETGALTPIATTRVGDSFTLDGALYDGERSRLNSAFCAAIVLGDSTRGAPIGTPIYISNPASLAESPRSYPTIDIKKGYYPGDTPLTAATAIEYGVENTVLDVELGELLTDDIAEQAFTHGNTTIYVDRAYLERLDADIQRLYGASVNVRLRLTVEGGIDSNVAQLIRSTKFCPFNIEVEESRDTLAAVFNFLASRYSGADRSRGRVLGYILGKDEYSTSIVDPTYYGSVGIASDYAVALRLLNNAVASNGSARVYLELDGSFDGSDGGHSLRTLLERLAAITRDGGDFMWGIVLDPYPTPHGVYTSWNDSDAAKDYSAKRITTANIEFFCEFLASDGMKCNGDVRRVILLDRHINLPGSQMEETLCAAEFVTAYYKLNTRECAAVECFIVSELHSYNAIFKYIDTDRSTEVAKFAMGVIGISDWRVLFDGYDEGAVIRREVIETEFASLTLPDSEFTLFSNADDSPIREFTQNSGISTLSHASGDIFKSGKLTDNAALIARLDDTGSAILGAVTLFPLDMSATEYLSFDIQAASLPGDITSANIKLLLYSGDSRLEASGIVEQGKANTMTLDISPFTSTGRRVDRIRIMLGGGDNAIGGAVIYISEIKLHSESLSSGELNEAFNTQRSTYFAESLVTYDMRMVVMLGIVIAVASLLLIARRIRPHVRRDADEDFTDMEIWRQ